MQCMLINNLCKILNQNVKQYGLNIFWRASSRLTFFANATLFSSQQFLKMKIYFITSVLELLEGTLEEFQNIKICIQRRQRSTAASKLYLSWVYTAHNKVLLSCKQCSSQWWCRSIDWKHRPSPSRAISRSAAYCGIGGGVVHV